MGNDDTFFSTGKSAFVLQKSIHRKINKAVGIG